MSPESPIVAERPPGSTPAAGRQAGDRGTEEVEQEETDVLVVEQLAVAGTITFGTDVFGRASKGTSVSKYSRPSMSLGCKARRRRLAISASLPSRQFYGYA